MNSLEINHFESFSQSFLEEMFNKLDIAVYIIDIKSHEILFINKFAQAKTSNTVGGKCYEQLFINQNHPCDGCTSEKILKQKNYSNTRKYFNNSENKWLYNIEQVINWNGTVAILEISIDVTEFKSSEIKLLESELLLKNVINELPNPFVVKNYEGKFLIVNKAVATLYGVENPDDMIGKDDGDYIPDQEQADFFRRNVQEIMDGGETKVVFEDSIDVETAERRNYMSIKKPYKNQKNENEILVITNDITEIRKAEETLLQYEKIISVSSDFLSYQDKNGIYQAVNDTYLKAFELKREDIIGKHQKDLLGYEHYTENIEPKLERVLKGENVYYEDWVNFPGIGRRFVHVNYHPYKPKGSNEVDGIVVQISDLTDRKNIEEELIHLANHDTLTGLANRRMFSDRLTQAIFRAKRNKNKMAVLFIDLDKFKTINDSLGHTVGDKLLQKVSILFKNNLREIDTLARSGGDEFLVLIEDFNHLKYIITICHNLLSVLQKPINIDEHELFVTASIGVSIYPDDATNEENLIQNADTAMYQAKKHGRNNYKLSNEKIRKEVFEKFFLENNLKKTIKNNELELFYQPQIDMKTKKLVGTEVLLRWNRKGLDFISPDVFIPIAEDSGFIIILGEWVLKNSCLQMKKWLNKGKKIDSISVNISGKQLIQQNFIDIVKESLRQSELEAHYLELEITESYLMNKTKDILQTLNDIKELGIRISIDDFGTSFSSLKYLQIFPISKLKIDRSFIREIPSNKGDCAIVKTIINLAKNMNMDIIAEGVETNEQKDVLLREGCAKAQGFLYDKPMNAKTFEKKYL